MLGRSLLGETLKEGGWINLERDVFVLSEPYRREIG